LDEVKQEASREDHSSSKECTKRPEGPQDPFEPVVVQEIKKRTAWLRSTLEEKEGHATLDGTSREVKRSKRFSSYAALMTKLIDAKPSTYEEATNQQVWKEVMNEEYQSIMTNDV